MRRIRSRALDGTDFGVDFNPVVDRLRVVSNTGQNLRINVDTGATITDDALNSAGATRTGVSATAYTNSFASACRTTLFYIDTNTDRLLTTSDPNAGTLSEIGNLGVNADAGSGYEIVTAADGTNSAIAVLTVGGATTLYTINLTSGAATATGAVTGLNSGETLRGIAAASTTTAPTQAPGSVLAVTDTNKLISFNNATPQKLCTSAAIGGLQAGENVLGIDTRPADGALYALGSTGRIYTIDTSTAAATQKSALVADAADASNPFTALDGTDFGVDFNPVPDRLRVVSNTGQNLRINVDTGATTTDTDAQSRRLDCHGRRLHQQLRRRGHDDVVRARRRERSPDDPGPAVRQSQQRRPASSRRARCRCASGDRLRHQRHQQRRVRRRHSRRRDDLRAAHHQSHERRSRRA